MKPVHLIALAVIGFVAYYFISKQQAMLATGSQMTQNQVQGNQSTVRDNSFGNLLSLIGATIDQARQTIAQVAPRAQ